MTKPTLEHVRTRLSYDPESGELRWIGTIGKRNRDGELAGTQTPAGLSIKLDHSYHLGHHIAWLFNHGTWPYGRVKLRNGDLFDLRAANLYSAAEDLSGARHLVLARARQKRYRDAMQERLAHNKAERVSSVHGVIWNKRTRLYDVYITRNSRKDPRDVLTFEGVKLQTTAEALARMVAANIRWLRLNPPPILSLDEAIEPAGPPGSVDLETVHNVLGYNPSDGQFLWRETAVQTGLRADLPNTSGTRVVQMFGRSFPARSLAWFMTYGEWPKRRSLAYREPPRAGLTDENRIGNICLVTEKDQKP